MGGSFLLTEEISRARTTWHGRSTQALGVAAAGRGFRVLWHKYKNGNGHLESDDRSLEFQERKLVEIKIMKAESTIIRCGLRNFIFQQ